MSGTSIRDMSTSMAWRHATASNGTPEAAIIGEPPKVLQPLRMEK